MGRPITRSLAWAAALYALSSGFAPAQQNLTRASFVVFGDNRGGRDGLQPSAFKSLVPQMAACDPDFVLGTGDYIFGGGAALGQRDQWNQFFWALAPLQSRKKVYFVPAAGNHDVEGSEGRRLFGQFFRRSHFSFDWAGSHFIVLNTEVPGQESRIAGEQLTWLKQDLAAAQNAWHIFVALHRPLYPVGAHRGDSLDRYPAERDALHTLFVRHRVTCVFAGHEHLYHQQSRDGVRYIITGGGGAPLYARPEAGGFHHFLLVRAERLRYKIDIVRAK